MATSKDLLKVKKKDLMRATKKGLLKAILKEEKSAFKLFRIF